MSLSFLRRRPPDPALLYGLLVTPLKQGPLLMSVSACALLQSSCRSGCYATFLDIAVAVPHGTREVVQCTPPFLDTLKSERPLWVISGHNDPSASCPLYP